MDFIKIPKYKGWVGYPVVFAGMTDFPLSVSEIAIAIKFVIQESTNFHASKSLQQIIINIMFTSNDTTAEISDNHK